MQYGFPHTFHIPVMGLAYTIDTPIKVARFGISSVVSIIEDNLVERMRCHYCEQYGEPYQTITKSDDDYRAKRITGYLNLMDKIVKSQVEKLKTEPFVRGSEICRYFEMLPDSNELKKVYLQAIDMEASEARKELENWLRGLIKPGSIDVNIMTKLDKNNLGPTGEIIEDGSDAVAALRGYANSVLHNSGVVLSAGMNPRLFNYMEKLPAFDLNRNGIFEKQIIIKVSDFRSALIQGKMLAKKGLWVSEFRIESGLNCGGHAFASDGYLLGPILEEFKNRKEELTKTLFDMYRQALVTKGKLVNTTSYPLKITVQGGIGTREEDQFLRDHYEVDGTGWGTPFLLVPEATTVDEHTLTLLREATEKDVFLSKNSPLGVRFHYLKGTTSEIEKNHRINEGVPGSPCTETFLVSNTEFGTEPICTASHTYQKKKLEQIKSLELDPTDRERQVKEVLDKECLCVGLSNAALRHYGLKPMSRSESVNVCPGPNIAYFSEIVSLQRMVDHIYGRVNLLEQSRRPHMFIKELSLYVDYWKELLGETKGILDHKRRAYVQQFYENLLSGISYYRNLTENMTEELSLLKKKLSSNLNDAEHQLQQLFELHLGKVMNEA